MTRSWLMAKGQSEDNLVDGEGKCHVQSRAFSFNLKGQSRATPAGRQLSGDSVITYIITVCVHLKNISMGYRMSLQEQNLSM